MDILTLIGIDVPLKRTASTYGGEWHGPCPFCGGRDRLAVWPNADRPGWWCRMCEKGGDAIQYLREQGHSYHDALRQLGLEGTEHRQVQPMIAPPVECEPPNDAWRSAASSFVLWAQEKLHSAPHAMEYLTKRGLTRHTIERAVLGYNPQSRECSRARWGMGPKDGSDAFYLPAGIVIPCYIGARTLWKVQIRRDVIGDGQDRYKTVTGSSNALYGASTCGIGKPAMLVEGPFDALAVQQTAGDLIGAAACGTSGARRVRWLSQLALCSEALISLDADAAGDSASAYWLDALPGSKRWRPYYADPSQMLQDDQDVRGWVLAGLGRSEPQALTFTSIPLDYWREEARLNSPALDRLRRICTERGADYEKTIAGLK